MPGAQSANSFVGNADTGRQRLFQVNMVADAVSFYCRHYLVIDRVLLSFIVVT